MTIASAALTANQAEFEFECGPHPAGELAVLSFTVEESLSALYQAEVDLVPGKDIVVGGTERRNGLGDKNLVGGSGNDVVLGGRSNDSISGGLGNDFVDGNPGSDNVAGEQGTDLVFEGGLQEASKDNLSGGPGNDWVAPLNDPAFGDVVTCGGGFDRVLADNKDVIAPDCEKVWFGLASEEAFFGSIPQSFDQGLP